MKKIIKVLKSPKTILNVLVNKNVLTFLPDKIFLKIQYKIQTGKNLNIMMPQTFNEKIQWLKLYDRRDEYISMVDKFEVKKIVEEKIGEQYIIPNIKVYDNYKDIDIDTLPDKFVIKCTHGSHCNFICEDKSVLDELKLKQSLKKWMNKNWFYYAREWPYKNVKPRIIVEKYMATEDQKELVDYKFFCFNGKPKFLYISEGLSNQETARMSFVDMDYNKTPFYRRDYKPFDKLPDKPKNFDKMIELAEKLSENIPFVRVDFYDIEDKIYFGELTFYPGAGYMPFEPEEWDKKLGDMLELPKEKIEGKNEK